MVSQYIPLSKSFIFKENPVKVSYTNVDGELFCSMKKEDFSVVSNRCYDARSFSLVAEGSAVVIVIFILLMTYLYYNRDTSREYVPLCEKKEVTSDIKILKNTSH